MVGDMNGEGSAGCMGSAWCMVGDMNGEGSAGCRMGDRSSWPLAWSRQPQPIQQRVTEFMATGVVTPAPAAGANPKQHPRA
jgi:hypothetical protein